MNMTEENFPHTLAAALYTIHQRPDNDGKWVKKIAEGLRSEHPNALSAFWKRLGLARELARLAGLSDVDTAALTLGLFFERVLDEQRRISGDAPRAWLDYFRKNENWLEPAIHVCALVHSGDHAESLAGAVAAIAGNYDRKTQIELIRPINALTALREEDLTDAETRVVELLWSEAGQAMCDRHFRAEEHEYSLRTSHVRDAIGVLKTRSKASGTKAASLSAIKKLMGEDSPPPPKLEPAPPDGRVTTDAFERRKAQLRGPSSNGSTGPANVVDINEHRSPNPKPPSEYSIREEQRVMEEPVNNDALARPYTDPAAVEAQLEELRNCLDQINHLSGNALGLLRALEPSMRRNARVAGELSSMVQRFEDDLQRVSTAA